ncbi:hypothetical protein ACI6QG_08160 [Roseococcus sp. DSY-14]|uniref:hypothetical protein n=1 Tax=Roseococcus sp. DSY-14 TaxID=3369650 RepID=UPI00387B3212
MAALLFLLPLVAFVLWMRLGQGRLPSRGTLAVLAVLVLATVAALAWWGLGRGIERGERYVPAVLRDGQVR